VKVVPPASGRGELGLRGAAQVGQLGTGDDVAQVRLEDRLKAIGSAR